MNCKKILIVSKNSAAALPYIREAAAFLASRGIQAVCLPERSRFFEGTGVTPLSDNPSEADVALVFGGDGTILKTASLLIDYGTPILGINMGTVGYLADSEPSDAVNALKKFLNGDYKTEKRSTLQITADGKSYTGINEVVVYRGGLGHILTLNVKIDGQDIETIRADGVIVSTPTGSTAYNLSAGGPVIAPLSHTFVLTPICAHSLTARPIVVGDESVITLTASDFRSKSDTPSLDVDGKTVLRLAENCRVDVKLAKSKVTLIRTKPTNFYKALQIKLGETNPERR
ncbi:MAG: NAD(+)/NADH kinase [Christensenellales bacterium]